MTKQEAKDLALAKLEFYKSVHPNYRRRYDLPPHLRSVVEPLLNHCPLCEMFNNKPVDGRPCGECPLTCPSCNLVSNAQLNENIRLIQAWEVSE